MYYIVMDCDGISVVTDEPTESDLERLRHESDIYDVLRVIGYAGVDGEAIVRVDIKAAPSESQPTNPEVSPTWAEYWRVWDQQRGAS